MRPLSPPLKVIEDNLFMPSISLLLRWTSNDQSLSSKTVKALENDPVAQELRTELKKQRDAPVVEEQEIEEDAPLPSFLKELIERRVAARDRYASSSIPSSGQILRLDQIICPDKKDIQDLSSPLAVLIEKKTQTENLWQGWMVASETDYAGYWDMLLEPEDEPFDPLAGMIQIWNKVQIYLPSKAPVLAELKPARLQAVRALAEEFDTEPKLDTSMSRPGHIAPRTTFGNLSVLTGTPLGHLEIDPRYSYGDLYHAAAERLREVALPSSQTSLQQGLSVRGTLANKMKKFLSLKDINIVGSVASCSNKAIKTSKKRPYTKDEDGNCLQLYLNKKTRTWRVSFLSVYQNTVEQASIIITPKDEKEHHITQKLKYRDGMWKFDESLHGLLEKEGKLLQHQFTLTVLYHVKDESQ